jgi:hypothetical protein
MMTVDQHLPDATAGGAGGHFSLASLRLRIAVWARTCADYYGAAAKYERLSRLSNAELRRRGMSRETLARDVCEACERRDES